MTQPTNIDMTFDTSLVDLNPSFSTTESDPTSEAGPLLPAAAAPLTTPEPEPSSQDKTPKKQSPNAPAPIQHLPTQTAYDQWSAVYDTDGNMLQAIDSLELATLLPVFLDNVIASQQQDSTSVPTASSDPPRTLHILELGCGTGRNTQSLLAHAYPPQAPVHITGLDFSSAMLARARTKLMPLAQQHPANVSLHLAQTDCFPSASDPSASAKPTWPATATTTTPVSALLCTLVLEHIPLRPFFATLAALLPARGAQALVTNMHRDMGRVAQAGFVNSDGVKIRGASWAHTLEETEAEAWRWGFEVVERRERAVERGDLEGGVVGRRGEKWVGVRVWFAVWLRRL